MVENTDKQSPPRPARPGSETQWRLARIRQDAATEGARVRLLIAIPVVLVSVLCVYAAAIYQLVQWTFQGTAPTDVMTLFAERWLLALAGSVVLGGVVGYFLGYSITAPIHRIIRMTRKLASGDFSSQGRASERPTDEVGVLSNEFAEMATSINRFVAARNRFIVESFTGGLLTTDLHGTVTAANKAAERVLGLPPDGALGRPAQQALASCPELLQLVEEALWKHEPVSNRVIEANTAEGRRALSVNTSYLRDEAGAAFGLITNFRDMSHVEEFYQQMARTEQLAMLGTFSKGIAHEIRNPLGSIKGITQLLAEDLRGNAKALEYAGVIVREANRLDSLLSDIQEFAQTGPATLMETDVDALVRETVMLARNNARLKPADGVEFAEAYGGLAPIMGNPSKLRQALLNLLANAVQATPAGGVIRVETSEVADHPMPVRLSITNSGSSIAARDLHKVFQPFFTTKEEGSGLGLAIARQIARSHGGDIAAESGEDFTRFVVLLPRSGIGGRIA